MTTQEAIESLQTLDFDSYNSYSKRWLRNLALTWLIEGHLTEESALKMVAITEASIKFSPFSP